MKFVVHYGHYECEDLKIFNTKAQAKKFIDRKKKKQGNPTGWFFEVFKVECMERIEL